MNRIFALGFLVVLLLSAGCQSNNDVKKFDNTAQKEKAASITGKWQLVKIIHGGTSKEVSGDSLPYKEVYEFRPDNTFARVRPDGWEATGTYTKKKVDKEEFIEATYQKAEQSYNNSNTVQLQQTSPDMIVESHLAYDGPAFYYQRIKTNN